MRWNDNGDSPDLIDRRGQGGGGGLGGILMLLPFLIRSPFGWLILLALGAYALCGRGILDGGQRVHDGANQGAARTADERQVHFVSFVLDDTQAVWTRVSEARHETYRHAKLVLFTDATSTGCGYGRAATGPFYCPADERVYIDLGFFHELEDRLGARGEFAKAYVIAHEMGHHVQKLRGISDKTHSLHAPLQGAGGTSVRLELQADCFAGVWANSTEQRKVLESGDLESALGAAAAIGDDRLQRQSTGTVSPESWTHGSSAQRTHWFRRGFDSGKPEDCDTFSASAL